MQNVHLFLFFEWSVCKYKSALLVSPAWDAYCILGQEKSRDSWFFHLLVNFSSDLVLCFAPAAPAKQASVDKTSSSPASVSQEDFVDDFHVGERVWVNGNKPGFIQFLGETQFAPGQWAGIVLDESIGKNDGSVGGVRYFQCEAQRGIFTRPSKLSRNPLADGEANGTQTAPQSRSTSPARDSASVSLPPPASSASAAQKTSTTPATPTTPTTPVTNLTRTASESVSNLSEAGSVKKGERELKFGDRVLVRLIHTILKISPLAVAGNIMHHNGVVFLYGRVNQNILKM